MAPAWGWAPVTNACAAARGRDDFVLERRGGGLELRGAQRSRARAGQTTRRSGGRRRCTRAPSCRRVVRALRRATDGWMDRARICPASSPVESGTLEGLVRRSTQLASSTVATSCHAVVPRAGAQPNKGRRMMPLRALGPPFLIPLSPTALLPCALYLMRYATHHLFRRTSTHVCLSPN